MRCQTCWSLAPLGFSGDTGLQNEYGHDTGSEPGPLSRMHTSFSKAEYPHILMSGTMVMVHPVSYGGETFLPCVYGYGCTVHRTQGGPLKGVPDI